MASAASVRMFVVAAVDPTWVPTEYPEHRKEGVAAMLIDLDQTKPSGLPYLLAPLRCVLHTAEPEQIAALQPGARVSIAIAMPTTEEP